MKSKKSSVEVDAYQRELRFRKMRERGWQLVKDKHNKRQVYFKFTDGRVVAKEGDTTWKYDMQCIDRRIDESRDI